MEVIYAFAVDVWFFQVTFGGQELAGASVVLLANLVALQDKIKNDSSKKIDTTDEY